MLLNLSSILDVGGKVVIGVIRIAWENVVGCYRYSCFLRCGHGIEEGGCPLVVVA